MRLTWGLILLLPLAACGGRKPASPPKPPVSPAPSAAPALITLCHYERQPSGHLWQSLDLTAEQAAEHSEHPADHPGSCTGDERPPRPPRPEPKEPGTDGATPIPPNPDPMTICHVLHGEGERERGRQTLTLPRERAEWHLEHHKAGDHAGHCKEREGS